MEIGQSQAAPVPIVRSPLATGEVFDRKPVRYRSQPQFSTKTDARDSSVWCCPF
ncbi:hypothetical protein [Limnothrix redekei]|uniref:Uncharacterized protein n=1 Tax=Limnothrix redekei LRLZ20PSL1 TaxID=3112953 RepID=A0ABW7CFG9_9CYAN